MKRIFKRYSNDGVTVDLEDMLGEAEGKMVKIYTNLWLKSKGKGKIGYE